MRRSAIALWATLCALALTAGPAAAQDARQTAEDSALAGQVGPVQVNAPVRVASDGNDEQPSASVGGPQTTSDSAGAAPVGPVGGNASVRVLSDGENSSAGGGGAGGGSGGGAAGGSSAGGPQAVNDSIGAAQVGPVEADAPVRVASDGDNGSAQSGSGGGFRPPRGQAGA